MAIGPPLPSAREWLPDGGLNRRDFTLNYTVVRWIISIQAGCFRNRLSAYLPGSIASKSHPYCRKQSKSSSEEET
jgi:hypothetical protein